MGRPVVTRPRIVNYGLVFPHPSPPPAMLLAKAIMMTPGPTRPARSTLFYDLNAKGSSRSYSRANKSPERRRSTAVRFSLAAAFHVPLRSPALCQSPLRTPELIFTDLREARHLLNVSLVDIFRIQQKPSRRLGTGMKRRCNQP